MVGLRNKEVKTEQCPLFIRHFRVIKSRSVG